MLSRVLWFLCGSGQRVPPSVLYLEEHWLSVPAHRGGSGASIRYLDLGQYIFVKTSVNRARSEGWVGNPAYQVRENGHRGEKCKVTLLSLLSLWAGPPSPQVQWPCHKHHVSTAPSFLCLSCLQNQYDVDNTHTLLSSAGSTRWSLAPWAASVCWPWGNRFLLCQWSLERFTSVVLSSDNQTLLSSRHTNLQQKHPQIAPIQLRAKNPGSPLKHFSVVCIILAILVFQAPTKRPLND